MVRYSLYYRAGNPRTQTDEDARKIIESSVLRGVRTAGQRHPDRAGLAGDHPGWRVRAGVRDGRFPRPAVTTWRPGLAGRLPRCEGWLRRARTLR